MGWLKRLFGSFKESSGAAEAPFHHDEIQTTPSSHKSAEELIAALKDAMMSGDMEREIEVCTLLVQQGSSISGMLAETALEFDPDSLEGDASGEKDLISETVLGLIGDIGELDEDLAQALFKRFIQGRSLREAKLGNWEGVWSAAVETLEGLGYEVVENHHESMEETELCETICSLTPKNERLEAVKNLLRDGKNPNEVSGYSRLTPLLCAAERGLVEITNVLLEAGAKATIQDADRRTALEVICGPQTGFQDKATIRAMTQKASKNADVETLNAALEKAIVHCDPDLIDILLNAGAQLTHEDIPAGRTLFDFLSPTTKTFEDIVRISDYLFEKGIRPTPYDIEGFEYYEHNEAADYLRQNVDKSSPWYLEEDD